MNRHLKFGIEEEYFITDLDTRRMAEQPPGAAIDACKAALGNCFAYEMFQGQIEVASPVFTRIAEAEQYFVSARKTLRCTLQSYGLGLLSVGSHPLAGRERGGAISARADLFIGRPWVITGSGPRRRARR